VLSPENQFGDTKRVDVFKSVWFFASAPCVCVCVCVMCVCVCLEYGVKVPETISEGHIYGM
jgi:hypothetical protein